MILAGCVAVIALHKKPKSGYISHMSAVSPVTTMPLVAFLGDSYTGGSNMGGNGPAGWPAMLAANERWSIDLDTVGGSGYLSKGTADSNFIDRIGKVVAQRPDMVIIWASRNDLLAQPSVVGTTAATLYSALQKQLPHAKLLVIGPTTTNGVVTPAFTALRDAERAAAVRRGIAFVDPLTERWFSGAYSKLISSDGVHPTDAGHKYLLALITADLHRLGLDKLTVTS